MSVTFEKDKKCAELLLRIILDRDDLEVIDSRTEQLLNNVTGRSCILDIYAVDLNGDRYDIEIQRADKGASVKRARYHSSFLDANMLEKGEDYDNLRENYVIFITENDVLGYGEPIYHIKKIIEENNVQIDDGSHIIYVNASMRYSDTKLSKLMSDLYCTDPDKMNYKVLADRVRYFKETEEGEKTMCDLLDDMMNKAKLEGKIEVANEMIKDGQLSLEKIAEYSGLSLEKIRELAGSKSA